MVKAQLSRHGRRRRIWLGAQISLFKKKSSILAPASKDGAGGQHHAGETALCSQEHCPDFVGIRSADLDDAVDFMGMWQQLELLMATPHLSTKLTTTMLAEAVSIALKKPCATMLNMKSLLLGWQSNHMIDGNDSLDRGSLTFAISSSVKISVGASGRGFYAVNDLPCGTTVLVEKPAVAVLDVETRRVNTWADLPSADTNALTCKIAQELGGVRGIVLHQLMAPLHPKEGDALPDLQHEEGEDEDADEDAELATKMSHDLSAAFAEVPRGESFKNRVMAVARLNGLGYYTNPEQVCHNDTYQSLTGTGLCLLASAFNHSCAPNVTRYSIGDVLLFRTIAPVSAGDELCISYIESESLSEPTSFRRQSLNRDFVCSCSKCDAKDAGCDDAVTAGESTRYLSVDAQLQAELAMMPPLQRIKICRSLLRGEVPSELNDEEEEEEEDASKLSLMLKDAQEIRAVLGIALTRIGLFREAWEVWVEAAQLATNGPAYDESLGVYVVLGALSAAAVPSEDDSWQLLQTAAMLHTVAFGGARDGDSIGVAFFKQRFAKEVDFFIGLSSDRMAQERQRNLWSRLSTECTHSRNSVSWPQIKDRVLSWRVPHEKKSMKRNRECGKTKQQSEVILKPKAALVNGLRVLP